MNQARFFKLQQVLNRRQPDLTVITDNVHKSRNLSAIVRTCDAVGIHQIHSARPMDGYGTHHGTAKGSHRWLGVNIYDEVSTPIQQLQQQGFKVIAATFSDRAVDYRKIDFTQPCALLLGAELEGVSAEAAELADEHVIVPMMGMVSSFNVSVAAAIILAEAQRQRDEKGLYDQCRLDTITYQKTLFEWAQPKVAEFCQQRQLPYPELDDEGDVADASNWHKQVLEASIGTETNK
ncbi:tRNA (guanosine-2'-O-)-methyltransferase [Oceanospirillum multiglobuliferum]|uniref:tRNA (guanosine(18)-2'-O)-methyltransferase n=1 Tax=Oceanospirillum multiglobuliferum TaxID=64969 RepID=A0A1T4QEK4_9GAMM|nr:tRNA (guanosine(18)-2'-O)-methyltransferase TrmH [Oceanospirillum multiglobuliferum]OPX56495.1 tRNA (guanosine(18)-2'-O)-methyltransferase TrmH [Oceanospirillum multiglobuliferum]SKA01931.1 tRNA (guanosine-2'-O-)-methyltransferase [Oceanospirillum multiglobuliferum]